MYYLIFIVSAAGAFIVQQWLRSTYNTWSQQPNASGLTGAETAKAMLEANGIHDVTVEPVKGMLTDHYDPTAKAVRLSEGNYGQASVAGMAVAAHEVGHAIQHATSYSPLQVRHALLPVANIGSRMAIPLIFGGFLLAQMGLGILVNIGIALFAAAVLFQVVTLPIEFDASRRALGQMEKLGLATAQDNAGSRKVLTAAAMTYVAAAASSLMYLLYFLSMTRR